jgi:predicted phosphoribosyltransferase
MTLRFANRAAAGEALAAKLMHYADFPGGLVLALPRGGVPVAHPVAKRLNLPLDVFIVRKLGVPGQGELAMGAISSGGGYAINERIVAALRIPASAIAATRAKEQRELERRERQYRAGRIELQLKGRTVILIDDGIATGASMRAASLALRSKDVSRIVLAAPVGSPTVQEELGGAVNEIIVLLQPEDFQGVGQWYADFAQVSDEEVCALLASAELERSRQH